MSFITNILKKTEENNNFREVLFTGVKSQLVVMDVIAGGEIGEEAHAHVEQTLFFLSGVGKAVLDGVEHAVNAGDVLMVTPGTRHNVVNTGADSLKIYTLYAPANHINSRTHPTKEDADKDIEDENFGESVA